MSLVDLSNTAASNTAAAPTGAPEGSFLLGDVSNTFRELMAVVRSLAASDTIAAAATTNLGSKTYATFLTLTGTATTITSLGTVSAGIYKFVVYNAAHTVTHNATSLILLGGASRTVADGDVSMFVSLGSGNWRELFYMNANIMSLAALTTTAYGRSLLGVADEAALKALINLEIGTDVQAYDADTLKADVADVLTAGFATTPYNAGTKSSGTFTPDEANGNLQYAVNGGAHTLAPMANNGTVIIQYTNNASAGAITTSGWTKVTGSFTTTDGDDFMVYCTVNNSKSHLSIVALQ